MINFPKNNTHECTSFRDGDWITFRCPFCHEYERKLNWRTGETFVKGKTDFRHCGLIEQTTQYLTPLTTQICPN